MKNLDDKIIEKYREYLIKSERSENTVQKYIRDVNAFAKWAGEREIYKELVVEFKEEISKNYKPRSVNSMLSSLNSLFDYLEWFDCKVKTIKIQRQTFAGTERELTKAEYERLLDTAQNKGDERLYYLMQTICSTGIRVSELQYITVEAICIGSANIDCKGKMRTVILPGKLCKALKKYAKRRKITGGAIFVTKSGKPLDRTNIWHEMKKIAKIAGVAESKVFPHNLRHLFARTYYSMYKDIVRLADILGHSNINTTRIYTMESGDVHRRQLEKTGLLRC